MKKIVLASALLVTSFAIGQREVKEEVKVNTPPTQTNPARGVKGEGAVNVPTPEKPKATHGASSGTKARSDEEFKGSLNGLIHSEYGRAQAAAAKAAPKTDDEAGMQISELNHNSKKGIEKAEEKITIAQGRLDELKAAGKLSQADYDAKMSELDAMVKRKDEIKSSL